MLYHETQLSAKRLYKPVRDCCFSQVIILDWFLFSASTSVAKSNNTMTIIITFIHNSFIVIQNKDHSFPLCNDMIQCFYVILGISQL